MQGTTGPSTICCPATGNYHAVYGRKPRRQVFTWMPGTALAQSESIGTRFARPTLRLWATLCGMVLLSLGTTVQSSGAAQRRASPQAGPSMPTDGPARLGDAAWSKHLATGLHCRSGIDGSSPDVVRQIKARIAASAGFAHIETTIRPRSGASHDLTMTFRTGAGPSAAIREARATVDPATCRATVLSLG